MYSLDHRTPVLFCFLLIASLKGAAQRGLRAEYFNDIELKQHVITKMASRPYLNFYLKSPAPGVNAEFFSIRWTGKIATPASGEYTFHIKADDGVRLWVNDRKLIDAWQDQEATDYSGSIYLEKNKKYDVRIEYYNTILHSVLMLSWEAPEDTYSLGYTFFKTRNEIPFNVFSVDTAQVTRPDSTTRRVATEITPLPGTRAIRNKPAPKKISNKPVEKQAIAINEPIELKSVHFEQAKHELHEHAHEELNTLITYLKKHPQLKIKIIGHTDYAGDSTANYLLSEQRANAVADYLKTNGVDQQRVVVFAVGSSQPRIIHDKSTERRQNRRVEFVLLEK